MSTAAVPATATPTTSQARMFDPMAGVLSYLIPGLGQIYQGRFGKGILFLVCLYGLFFYGMHLGNYKNVYVELKERFPVNDGKTRVLDLVLNRIRFAGQFWIGVAAWPAILHHYNMTVPLRPDFQRVPTEDEINELQQKGDKTWDLGWVCTIIAGVLNILVIYDAVAGPAFRRPPAVPGLLTPTEAATS